MPPRLHRLTLGTLEIVDVRELLPPAGPMARWRDISSAEGIAVHHDGVIMTPGDRDYSGSTLDEDLERIQAIRRHSEAEGWGTFPYHMMASPHGRTFYTVDLRLFGAHVGRRNHQLLGVALMGDFTHAAPSDLQLCAAARAVLALCVWGKILPPLGGHRELALAGGATACPGDTWTTWEPRLVEFLPVLAALAFPR